LTYQVDFHQTNIIYFVILFSLLVNTVAVFISKFPPPLVAVIELIATTVGRLSFYCAHRLRHRENLVWSIVTTGEYLMCIVELTTKLTTTFTIPLVVHQQPLLLAAPSSSPPTSTVPVSTVPSPTHGEVYSWSEQPPVTLGGLRHPSR
jgi:hypothetical protein